MGLVTRKVKLDYNYWVKTLSHKKEGVAVGL